MGRQHTGPSLGQAIDLQEHGLELKVYGEIDDPNMRYFNPSVAWHGNDLKIAIRSCNFAVKRHGNWSLRDGSAYSKTDVIYGDLNPETLQVIGLTKLKLKDAPIQTQLAGLEDVRIYERKGDMYAIGFESDRLTRSLHNKSASMAEYLITGYELEYIRTLKKPNPETVEKNWSPTDVAAKEFDFTYSDTQVYKDGTLIGESSKTEIHGGSQLLLQEDGTYLSIVHEKVADRRYGNIYDKFVYYTYLARHGKDGIITHLTKPFRFGTHENIEFASGMVEYKGHFIIALGIRDAKYGIAKIKKETLVDLLAPVKE